MYEIKPKKAPYLKPCPMCKNHSKPGWRKRVQKGRGYDHVSYFKSGVVYRPYVIYCDKCHCSISGETLEIAMRNWNDRRRWEDRK